MTALAVVGLACALLVARRGASSADVLQAQHDSLSAAADSLSAAADSLKAAGDSLSAAVDSLEAELAEEKVGFLPCWRGNDPGGYYFTYNVTFQDGRFSVTPHEHWALGTELRRTIPQSLVNVLEEFPQGDVAGEQLASFGERVDRALQETGYPADCRIAVTLNDGGKNETHILTRAGFFPVWR